MYYIFCDGFLKHKVDGKELRFGCSVALLDNDDIKMKELYTVNRLKVKKLKKFLLKYKTSNTMEYFALYKALILAKKKNLEEVKIYSDSMLVVNQMDKIKPWSINEDYLLVLNNLCKKIIASMKCSVEIIWIKRDANVKILGH